MLRERTWAWFATRVAGLLNKTPTFTPDGRQLQATRLGLVLNPPGEPRRTK